MAIRALEIRKDLDLKTAELQRADEALQAMQTRREEIEVMIREAENAEQQAEADKAIEAYEADVTAAKSAAQVLRDSIAELTKELDALEDDEPSAETEKIERKIEAMENIEIRNSAAYVNAYANYIKTGNVKEVRSLLSENAAEENITGVAVPDIVEATVKHAWEQTGIMSLIRKTYIKGNVKVGFELSATGAVVHEEGADAPTEEDLQLGIVTLWPESVKKWITISDEAMDLSGAEFLQYIYSELTYRIAKKVEDELIKFIVESMETSAASMVGVKSITAEPALGTIATAIANLSDEATSPVIVMNKLTYAAFKTAQYEANFAADPFEGLTVLFNNSLPAYSAASSQGVYMLVGDFTHGAQANFPNGDGITIKVDDVSLAEKDLVKFVGRCFVGARPVAPGAFVRVKKA